MAKTDTKDESFFAPKGHRKMSDIVSREEVMKPSVNMQDIEGREVLVTNYDERRGENGTYLILHITDPATEESFTCACGGVYIMQYVKLAKTRNGLPALATFTRQGRAWVIAD